MFRCERCLQVLSGSNSTARACRFGTWATSIAVCTAQFETHAARPLRDPSAADADVRAHRKRTPHVLQIYSLRCSGRSNSSNARHASFDTLPPTLMQSMHSLKHHCYCHLCGVSVMYANGGQAARNAAPPLGAGDMHMSLEPVVHRTLCCSCPKRGVCARAGHAPLRLAIAMPFSGVCC